MSSPIAVALPVQIQSCKPSISPSLTATTAAHPRNIPTKQHKDAFGSLNSSPHYQNSVPVAQTSVPVARPKSSSPGNSPVNFRCSPPRPSLVLNTDISPKNSPPTSPRIRPASIDMSFARLNLDKLVPKQSTSSRLIPRPQKRIKSILKQTSSESPVISTPSSPLRSKLQFNVTIEHICLFARDDTPNTIQDSERSTVNDCGDMEAISASAGWAALHSPAPASMWTVATSNHNSIVKMALHDAVQLESARVQGDTLTGGIIVRNYDFQKLVLVRYSIDGWNTSSDVQAEFCNSIKNVSNDPYGLDRFTFSLVLSDVFGEPDVAVTKTICYAVQYSVASRTYWDNNHGANYSISIKYNPEAHDEPVDAARSWESSVPRPRQRSRKNGLRKVTTSNDFEEPRRVSIAPPLKNLSNFDSFDFQIDESSFTRYSTSDFSSGFGLSYSSSFYGSSYSTSFSNNFSQSVSSHVSQTLITKEVSVDKPIAINMYEGGSEDYFMSSPPSILTLRS
ncbi:hypothetical protein HK096_009249 [Nowakowskiella sp. JEL0078]|nr:hypothetical protein HK096_009249 [Nowakowskiella sp. JEL0078]